jgi:hypothetical protein
MASRRVQEMALRMAKASTQLRDDLKAGDGDAGVNSEQAYAHIRAMQPTDAEVQEAAKISRDLLGD